VAVLLATPHPHLRSRGCIHIHTSARTTHRTVCLCGDNDRGREASHQGKKVTSSQTAASAASDNALTEVFIREASQPLQSSSNIHRALPTIYTATRTDKTLLCNSKTLLITPYPMALHPLSHVRASQDVQLICIGTCNTCVCVCVSMLFKGRFLKNA
jgi:hypothetical protein